MQIHVEFPTVCRYELPIKVIVNNNASLGQILWELLALGYPELGIAFEHRPDFAPWARACGGVGIRIDTAAGLEAAIGEAFAHPGAALVDVTVSPDEPPLPGKVEPEQAGFVKSLLSGQPRKKEIAGNLIRDKLAKIQPDHRTVRFRTGVASQTCSSPRPPTPMDSLSTLEIPATSLALRISSFSSASERRRRPSLAKSQFE